MQIVFRFNLQKALQVLCYLLEKLGPTDKVKLIKLVYLADRTHFIEHGTSITGDRQCAMKWGPVPSCTLDALNGEVRGADAELFAFIHINDNRVEQRRSPGQALLSGAERDTLDRIIREHGAKQTWSLVEETHRLPEYVESYVEGTSTTIPYERIAKFSGSEARFRNDRAVISLETAAQMTCPFPPDSDL